MVIIGPLTTPEEGLIKKLENVTMKINSILLSPGVLYITRNYLRWHKNGEIETISIPWQNITLHAISNAPVKCIYLMLDLRLEYPVVHDNGNGAAHGNGNENDDDIDEGTCEDEEPEMTEIWFTPTDENTIEDIFNAMKYCQSLHPDENDSISEEEDEDEFLAPEEGNDGDDEVGQGDMRNLHIDDDDRFADAEE